MANEDARKSLESEILQEGRKRTEALLSAAKAEAEKHLADARAGAQSQKEKTLKEARARAEQRAQMILRTAEQEIARRKLRARQEVVQAAMDQADALLEKLSGPDYRQAVVRMAAEAIHGMNGSSFVIHVAAPAGESLDLNAVAAEITSECRKTNRLVSLRMQSDPAGGRGVVVESADGRMRWDNRFSIRLRRLRDELRRRIVPVLFEEG